MTEHKTPEPSPVYSFEGGPWDGQHKEVRGHCLRLYVAEQPGVDCVQFPPRFTDGLVRKAHVYALAEGRTYIYQGVE